MSVRNAQDQQVDKDLVKIPDIPGTPTIGTATDVGTNRAYNNGAATITYTGNAYWGTAPHRATSSPGSFNALASSSPITVTGLQSATAYTFTVSGESFAGSSAASAASNSITATTVPQTPTIGTVSVTNSTTVSIPFTAGATGGKTISSYTVTSSPSISLSVSGTTTPLTVTGSFVANQAYTFTIAAVNANGTSLSSSTSNSVTPLATEVVPMIQLFKTSGYESGFGSFTDSVGTRYITGFYGEASFENPIVIKQTASGTITWQKQTSFGVYDDSRAVIADSSGNVYFGGYPSSVTKLDSNGNLLWSRRITGGANVATEGLKLDSSGNIYSFGYSTNANGGRVMATVKLNPSGGTEWTATLGTTTSSSSITEGQKGVLDSAGNAYAISLNGTIAKYNSSGTLQSQTNIASSSLAITAIFTSALNPSETVIYLAGGGGLVSYNLSGNVNWQLSTPEIPEGVAVDSNGDIYLGMRNGYITKVSSSGTVLWQRRLTHSSGYGISFGLKMFVAHTGIYVTGQQRTSATSNLDEAMSAVLPTDGSKTGTYSLDGFTYTYAAVSNSYTLYTTGFTVSDPGYSTAATVAVSTVTPSVSNSSLTKVQVNL